MSQPWSNQGATPLPDKSSRSKQDGRRRSKRTETDATIEQTTLSGRTPYTLGFGQRRESTSLLERPSINEVSERSGNGSAVSPYGYCATGSANSTSFLSQSNSVAYPTFAYPSPVAQSSQQPQSYAPVVASTTKGKSVAKVDEAVVPYSYTDPKSGIKTAVIEGPPSKITAAEFQQQGILAQKSIVESRKVVKGSATGNEEKATPKSEVKAKQKDSFKFGNVIELLYVPPRSGGTTLTHFARDVGLSRTRRFVVIREGQARSMLLPISTYGGRGVTDPRVVKSHHCVIYSTAEVPPLLQGEGPTRDNAGDSLRRAIKVNPEDRTRKLDDRSRLNLAKIYQIDQAGCEVDIFGAVVGEEMRHLLYQFDAVQDSLPAAERLQATHYDDLMGQRQDGRQAFGQPAPNHGRVDSVQQIPSREAPKSRPEQGNLGNVNISRQPREESEASSSVANLTQQINALNVRAQSAGLDLSRLNSQQRNYLAQLPFAEQTRRILDVLRQQNPQKHAEIQARVMQARAGSTQAVQGSAEEQTDNEDSDDEDDSDESSEEE